jgi:hypothetical protein
LSDPLPLQTHVGIAQAEQVHDHGKFMLAFIMVWAYFAFSHSGSSSGRETCPKKSPGTYGA